MKCVTKTLYVHINRAEMPCYYNWHFVVTIMSKLLTVPLQPNSIYFYTRLKAHTSYIIHLSEHILVWENNENYCGQKIRLKISILSDSTIKELFPKCVVSKWFSFFYWILGQSGHKWWYKYLVQMLRNCHSVIFLRMTFAHVVSSLLKKWWASASLRLS